MVGVYDGEGRRKRGVDLSDLRPKSQAEDQAAALRFHPLL